MWFISCFECGNAYVIIFCHKIQCINSTERNHSIYSWRTLVFFGNLLQNNDNWSEIARKFLIRFGSRQGLTVLGIRKFIAKVRGFIADLHHPSSPMFRKRTYLLAFCIFRKSKRNVKKKRLRNFSNPLNIPDHV